VLDPAATPHPTLSFALDVADKVIKLLAVLLGGIWTYWNYKKSRTYAQKMELQMSGSIFSRGDAYVEIAVSLKNLGAAKHSVQQQGTYCEIAAVFADLTVQSINLSPIFARDEYIEPGETIHDRVLTVLPLDATNIVWIRADMRVVSGRVEWRQSHLLRVEADSASRPNEGD
jgi:hypothetical protein